MELAKGDILGGKYRIERLLGRGGMGAVFAATHLELDEMVAIKVLHGEAQSALGNARFQREARAAVRLRSQHVARVLDIDRLPDGGRYMVLEYLEGQDLARLVEDGKRLPAPDAASYILQACEGLAEAHALGMVHRDIKLQNLFLTQGSDGRPLVKILDFGIVKITGTQSRGTEPSLTEPSQLIGSLRYMSPEQLRSDTTVDARADVWALGVCLYYLIAGEPPFAEAHLGALYTAIAGRPAARLDAACPGIPAELADVVERALEKNVTRRYQDVRELAEGLEPFGVDAGTVVGIAWRISNVLRPRKPTPKLAPAVVNARSEADTAPDVGSEVVVSSDTAPFARNAETTLALGGATLPSHPPAATSSSETPPNPDDLAGARPSHTGGQASWRMGFAVMAVVALVVAYLGTSGVLRRRAASSEGPPATSATQTPALGSSPSTDPVAPIAPIAPIAPAPTTPLPPPFVSAGPVITVPTTTPPVRGARGSSPGSRVAPGAGTSTNAAGTPAPTATTATPATTGSAKKGRDRPSSYDKY